VDPFEIPIKPELLVDAKMTRKGLTAKEVSGQLIIDAAEYRQHPESKTLVCLVYDPNGLIKNPGGIERDLAKLSGDGLEMVCVIMP
jgi:REase_DpnII-MboI